MESEEYREKRVRFEETVSVFEVERLVYESNEEEDDDDCAWELTAYVGFTISASMRSTHLTELSKECFVVLNQNSRFCMVHKRELVSKTGSFLLNKELAEIVKNAVTVPVRCYIVFLPLCTSARKSYTIEEYFEMD